MNALEDQSELPLRNADGVDLTLIRWMLSLTPSERLSVLDGYLDSITRIRALNAHR